MEKRKAAAVIEMPEKCSICEFMMETEVGNACFMGAKNISEPEGAKPDWCPLMPILSVQEGEAAYASECPIGQTHGKRIYISGPITGIDNYQEKFKAAEELLLQAGYEPVNPASMDKALPEWMGYEDFMEIDLCLLNMCSSIYMLKGWEQSRGANREYGYALAKGMEILFE